MEIFRGEAHLPGADKEWNLELEIDWPNKEVNVHIDEELKDLIIQPDKVTENNKIIIESSFCANSSVVPVWKFPFQENKIISELSSMLFAAIILSGYFLLTIEKIRVLGFPKEEGGILEIFIA